MSCRGCEVSPADPVEGARYGVGPLQYDGYRASPLPLKWELLEPFGQTRHGLFSFPIASIIRAAGYSGCQFLLVDRKRHRVSYAVNNNSGFTEQFVSGHEDRLNIQQHE